MGGLGVLAPGLLEELERRGVSTSSEPRARRCVECHNTVPAPRRKLCSDRCAHAREMKLQTLRRKRAGL